MQPRALNGGDDLEGFVPHLEDAGVGSISEVFDAEARLD
jgi:hypothetical protein